MTVIGKLSLILVMTLGFQGLLLNVRISHLSIEKLCRPNKNFELLTAISHAEVSQYLTLKNYSFNRKLFVFLEQENI